jgi:hypothetical protein
MQRKSPLKFGADGKPIFPISESQASSKSLHLHWCTIHFNDKVVVVTPFLSDEDEDHSFVFVDSRQVEGEKQCRHIAICRRSD